MEQHIDLEGFKYAAMQVLPKDMIVDFSQDQMGSFVRDRVAVMVERKVYGHRLAEWDLELEVPTNWWQHLRRTLGLTCKTTTQRAHITRQRIYPDVPIVPEKAAGISYVVEDN